MSRNKLVAQVYETVFYQNKNGRSHHFRIKEPGIVLQEMVWPKSVLRGRGPQEQ